ncbi:hypothetical protein JW877_04695 [bacterium]|nr:hypothetical protein [bacterium]
MNILKSFFISILLVIIIAFRASPTSYCQIIVEGDTSLTYCSQGTAITVKADCIVGSSCLLYFISDRDSSLTLNEGDHVLGNTLVLDGDTLSEEFFIDSISGPDGQILFQIPMIWIAPGRILITVTDQDLSQSSDWIDILSHPDPPITISGIISVEGLTPPNPLLAEVFIIAPQILSSATSDTFGQWSMNIPYGGFEVTFEVRDQKNYLIPPGDFVYTLPESSLYGMSIPMTLPDASIEVLVADQYGEPLEYPVILELCNLEWEDVHRSYMGYERLYGALESTPYLLQFDEETNAGLLFPFLYHDTLEFDGIHSLYRDITVFTPNELIYGFLEIPDSFYSRGYYFKAQAGNYYASVISNVLTGEIRFPVNSELADSYWVFYDTLTGRSFPPPEDYIVYPQLQKTAPGDTVFFRMVSYEEALATLTGRITDQYSAILPGDLTIYLGNYYTGSSFIDTTSSGYYHFSLLPGKYRLSSSYDMVDYDPPYLYPNYFSPFFEINLGLADSTNFDFPCFLTNDTIFLWIDQDGGYPSQRYKFRASHFIMGTMIRHCSTSSNWVYLPVADDFEQPYNVYLAEEDTPLPEGLFTEGEARWNAFPGDTIFLHITPYEYYISGIVTRDLGDYISEQPIFQLLSIDLSDLSIFDTVMTRSDGSYYSSVPTGLYRIQSLPNEQFMFKPFYIDSLVIFYTHNTNNNFTFNLRSCSLLVELSGIPPDSIPLYVFKGSGDSLFPHGYIIEKTLPPGTTNFGISICDAVWTLHAPHIRHYTPEPTETTILIEEETFRVLVNFHYSFTGISAEQKTPFRFSLRANYPDPFNTSTTIEYSLDNPGMVTIQIFDLSGALVNTLLEQKLKPGSYSIKWNGKDQKNQECGSSVYLIRLVHLNRVKIDKMLLIK